MGFVFVNTFGFGMYLTAGLLYLTRNVGLSAASVGLALSIAGLIALPSNLAIGRLSDRVGPRGLAVVLLTVEGVAMFALVAVRSMSSLAIVATVGAVAAQGSRTMRSVLIGRAGGADRVRLRSYARTVSNLAIALGAAAAGGAVHADSRSAYLAVVVINGATFFAAAVILSRLPHYPPIPSPATGSTLPVLRNRAFLGVTVLNAVLMLQGGVLSVAVPLWIVQATAAPRVTVSVVFLLNTALVVLLQIRVGQKVRDVASSSRALRRCGLLFLFSCTGFACTGALSAVAAVVVLLAVVGLHTAGELWHSAATFELAYGLAPEHAQGEYQSLFTLGVGGSMALAPYLLTLLCLTWAPYGWIGLGALLAVTGLALGPVVRQAERHLATERRLAAETSPPDPVVRQEVDSRC
jgi:MFS family permease